MRACDIRSEADLVSYLTDCTLATVSSMSMKKSRPVGEYQRQISIAQLAINKGVQMGVRFDSRAADVISAGGSVSEWANQYELSK